jgi:hypothetical protein
VVVALIAGMAFTAVRQRDRAEAEARRADDNFHRAIQSAQEAQRALAEVERQRLVAEQERADACYLKARPLDNTDFVMGWRKQMTRTYVIRVLEELKTSN